MRVRNYCSISVLKLIVFSVLVIMVGCSNNIPDGSKNNVHKSGGGDSSKSSSSPTTEDQDKGNQHTHSSNPCTSALTHSHAYTVKDHEHSYDCESTNDFISNAHIHPATEKHRKYRHVHPNGASEHSHHRE